MPGHSRPTYEFSVHENGRFSRLAAVMQLAGVSMFLAAAGATAVVVGLGRSSLASAAVLAAPLSVLAIAAVQSSLAAWHLRRIATTTGNDIENLLKAIGRLTTAYRLQGWLWLVAFAVTVIGWATTSVGR